MELTDTQQFEIAKHKMSLKSASKEQVINLYIKLLTLYYSKDNLVKSELFKQLGLEK